MHFQKDNKGKKKKCFLENGVRQKNLTKISQHQGGVRTGDQELGVPRGSYKLFNGEMMVRNCLRGEKLVEPGKCGGKEPEKKKKNPDNLVRVGKNPQTTWDQCISKGGFGKSKKLAAGDHKLRVDPTRKNTNLGVDLKRVKGFSPKNERLQQWIWQKTPK